AAHALHEEAVEAPAVALGLHHEAVLDHLGAAAVVELFDRQVAAPAAVGEFEGVGGDGGGGGGVLVECVGGGVVVGIGIEGGGGIGGGGGLGLGLGLG